MADLTARQAQILDLLKHRPRGLSTSDVGKATGLTQGRAAEVLRQLRKLGLAEPTTVGHTAVWSTPKRCIELRRIAKERAMARARTAERRRREQIEEDAELRAWLRPVRILVPAGLSPPPITTAPNSVFNQRA